MDREGMPRLKAFLHDDKMKDTLEDNSENKNFVSKGIT
jgi:hypothetical protein